MNNRAAKSSSKVRIVSSQSSDSCYIYGILGTGTRTILGSRPIGRGVGSRIYTIPYRDISALVSRTPYVRYDPSEENLLIHNGALQEAYSEIGCTVLPLRFSTVAKSEGDVIKVLAGGYFKFKKKLAALGGKVEVAVKLLCKVEELRKDLATRFRAQGGANLDQKMSEETYRLGSELLGALVPLSVKHTLNDLVFDDMVMNAAFLVEESRAKEFLLRVNSFDAEKRHLTVQISGPYVPYTFSEPE